MSESDGLICAYDLNEAGGGRLSETWDALPSAESGKPG